MRPASQGWIGAAAVLATLFVLGCASSAPSRGVPPNPHVVLVIMENKSYDEVRTQPYTASLMQMGATLTNASAVAHPSQPNYFALWAGSTFGIADDACPPDGAPFLAANLGQACEAAGLTWRTYAEDLPAAASTVCSADSELYVRKHAPWTYFTNVDHASERPFADLAGDLASNGLPNLAVIVPNNCHNSHNSSTPGCGVSDADAWLEANLPPLIAALGSDGVLILTWDEGDASSDHILTVIVGPHVTPGSTYDGAVTHYTVLRAICDKLRVPAVGAARLETPVGGIWSFRMPVPQMSWGASGPALVSSHG
jgi:phospholipase C